MSYDKVYKKLESFGFKNLPGRMAYVLLYLKQDKYLKQDVYMDLSRKDLAELAGVPMESAVRILSDFVKSKLIELRGRNIEIIDLPRLEAISRGG